MILICNQTNKVNLSESFPCAAEVGLCLMCNGAISLLKVDEHNNKQNMSNVAKDSFRTIYLCLSLLISVIWINSYLYVQFSKQILIENSALFDIYEM